MNPAAVHDSVFGSRVVDCIVGADRARLAIARDIVRDEQKRASRELLSCRALAFVQEKSRS